MLEQPTAKKVSMKRKEGRRRRGNGRLYTRQNLLVDASASEFHANIEIVCLGNKQRKHTSSALGLKSQFFELFENSFVGFCPIRQILNRHTLIVLTSNPDDDDD